MDESVIEVIEFRPICIRQWERKALGGRISQRGVVSGVPVERGWRLVAGGGPYLFRLCFALA